MPTNTELKKFAQSARRQLREQVAARLEQVLGVDSVEVREKASAVAQLRQQLAVTSKAEVIDRVAYTWFNRFCALRYMDVNHYTNVGVVSPAAGNTQPEILQEAKAGFINEDLKNYVTSKDVFDLLSGAKPSANPQQEAYRLLLVGVCNSYFKIMPFMFEEIADYTELLMPLDLLSENSILFHLREVLTEEACQDVEVIGWLYQYYISERKDEVFEALKKNQKIEAKDIPAATQLFTPHWIVRYLVENSLGRLWLLNKPKSILAEKMDYYIKPVDEETDFLEVASPEELKICDPACGSGHMLTYAFDLLYSIYTEEGYEPASISSLILQKNLYGIEIDGRAGALAAFALAMKARGKDKRFFSRGIQPNVCVLENVSFTDQEIKEYINAVGRDLFTEPLLATLKKFEQADNFGSLIRPILTNPEVVRQSLEQKNMAGNIFLFGIHERVLRVLKQCEYLSPKYHVVVANPPYMGASNMNDCLKSYTRDAYKDSYSDSYSMFISRNLLLCKGCGFVGMITIPNWMFLNSFEEIRKKIIDESSIISLIHNGRGVWGSDFGSCSFILENKVNLQNQGSYKRLFIHQGEVNSNTELIKRFNNNFDFPYYHVTNEELKLIPGMPIAYWADKEYYEIFKIGTSLENIASPKQGTSSGDNELFLRLWFEVSYRSLLLSCDNQEESINSPIKWYPATKGGDFRKWYGNNEYIIDWCHNGQNIRNYPGSAIRNPDYNFLEGITWTGISSTNFGVRYCPNGFVFTISGKAIICKDKFDLNYILAFLSTKIAKEILKILTPGMSFEVGYICKLPMITTDSTTRHEIDLLVVDNLLISKRDWDNYETSWNFEINPIYKIKTGNSGNLFFLDSYKTWRSSKEKDFRKMKSNEEKINQIFIDIYRLQKSIQNQVENKEITLNNSTDFLDTQNFISYAVGCMFGRYSLNKPGLVLANQGETLQDYLRQVPDPTFLPDEDNVIPVIGGDWFQDDISERFKKFLKVTFGEEHYPENLQFIEEAIGRDIESYFLKEFYDYHVKMYKKRPIYWLFSSPKGTFNALIYMHRYNKDTVSILLNDYLRQFRVKLESRRVYFEKLSISASSSQRERTLALKELETLKKQLDEITTYENKVIFPLATRQIEIDLDDGVKANYPKFGDALVPIKGLND
ncbi:MAG: BREX-1 system adenine-specific DNA-methyltransferase PglX [Anaerolineaceae bacterium]